MSGIEIIVTFLAGTGAGVLLKISSSFLCKADSPPTTGGPGIAEPPGLEQQSAQLRKEYEQAQLRHDYSVTEILQNIPKAYKKDAGLQGSETTSILLRK